MAFAVAKIVYYRSSGAIAVIRFAIAILLYEKISIFKLTVLE
jgi:hypothetical protein